ncbi:MAG: uroporphyrinogen-III synthase [Pararhodobacter sp.]|nr:uroporphyrinogen-III synthase [Pararhodobacter sp.]
MPSSSPCLPLLLLTRPRPQSTDFAAKARMACPPHDICIAPLSEIVPLGFDPTVFSGARGLVLTSRNAIAMLAEVPGVTDLPAYCVGPGTALAAGAAGFRTHETGGDAARMIEWLVRYRPPGPLVHAHGRHLARDLAGALASEGIEVRAVPVYEARALKWPPGLADRLAGRRTVAPLFSPRAAAALARETAGRPLPQMTPVTISAACTARLPTDLRRRALQATAPDAQAMMSAIITALSQAGSEP